MGKSDDLDLEDDLRSEYDLKTLHLVRRGLGAGRIPPIVRCSSHDVAEAFPMEQQSTRHSIPAESHQKELKQEAEPPQGASQPLMRV